VGDVKVGYPQPIFHLVELLASKTDERVLGVYLLVVGFKGEELSMHIRRLVAVN